LSENQVNEKQRLRELQSIPDRDRTEEQWDELSALEIRLAPGNRQQPANQSNQPNQAHRTEQRPAQQKPGGSNNNNQRRKPQGHFKRRDRSGPGQG